MELRWLRLWSPVPVRRTWRPTGTSIGGSGPQTRSVLLGDGVLQLLPGLLEVRAALLGLALGFLRLVAGDLAEPFLALALQLLGPVACLVLLGHGGLLPF